MKPFLSNAHTHSTFCDGRSTIEETIAMAKEKGFVSLGFSGHASQGFDAMYSMMDGRQEAYFETLRACQRSEKSLHIWAGLEMDLMAETSALKEGFEQADYVIGSTHYAHIDAQKDCYVAYDGQLPLLTAYVENQCDGDGMELARRYFDTHSMAVCAHRPQIIGHFDLVRKHAKTLGFFNEADPVYRKLALNALEKVFQSGAVLEVNTGGMARSGMCSPYPTDELLGAWREMGGDITLTSDCHFAPQVDYAFEETMRKLAALGYRQVLRLGRGESLWEDISL